MTYEIDIAGLTRQLPLCPLNDELAIGAFVIFGDVELTVHCAAGTGTSTTVATAATKESRCIALARK